MLQLSTSKPKHTDLQPSRIAKDEADVKSLTSMLDGSWINPFLGSQQDLLCLLSGKLASPETERDLLQAEASGEKAFRTFSCKRLETNPPKVKFNDPMKKMKLKTFADLAKKSKVSKAAGKEVVIKADCVVFAQMIIIAENS